MNFFLFLSNFSKKLKNNKKKKCDKMQIKILKKRTMNYAKNAKKSKMDKKNWDTKTNK